MRDWADGCAEPTDAARVMSLLNGAAAETGFKGIGRAFMRRELLALGADVPLEVRFWRIDCGAAIDAAAYIQRVPADPALPALLQRCLSGAATPDEAQRCGDLWQERVRRILLDHSDDPQVFVLRRIH